MLLKTLCKNTTVQGDVTLTLWDCNDVEAEDFVHATEDLGGCECVKEFWGRKHIKYIFASADGLHIEFESEEE